MNGALASFRELKGIGPTTEARLHEAGIYTWEALAAAATALAGIRGPGDTLREVAALVTAQAGHGEEEQAPDPEDGERLEAFVLRMAVGPDGRTRRSTATHVRTMTEHAWPGWVPAELAGFIVEQSGLEQPEPVEQPEPLDHGRPPGEVRGDTATAAPAGTPPEGSTHPPIPAQAPPAQAPPSESAVPPADGEAPSPSAGPRTHVVLLEAGKVIGGTGRDIGLRVGASGGPETGFGCRATLLARQLGASDVSTGWSAAGERRATWDPPGDLELHFTAVELAAGVHRLRLRLELALAAADTAPPVLALVRREEQAG